MSKLLFKTTKYYVCKRYITAAFLSLFLSHSSAFGFQTLLYIPRAINPLYLSLHRHRLRSPVLWPVYHYHCLFLCPSFHRSSLSHLVSSCSANGPRAPVPASLSDVTSGFAFLPVLLVDTDVPPSKHVIQGPLHCVLPLA